MNLHKSGSPALVSSVVPPSRTSNFLFVLLCLILGSQRVAIPLGSSQIPATVPVVVIATVAGLLLGLLRVDVRSATAFAFALVIVGTLSFAVAATGTELSATSLVLLLAIYSL